MAQALLSTGHCGEARRWCDRALAAARGAGSAEDQADALITLGRLEAFDDPAGARRRYATARAWAVEAGNREIELRVLRTHAWLEYTLGKPDGGPCGV